MNNNTRARRKLEHRCVRCNASLSDGYKKITCAGCLTKARGYMARRQEAAIELDPDYWRHQYEQYKDTQKTATAAWYAGHKAEVATREKVRRQRETLAAQASLGGKCVICGIDDPLVLEFDHIYNDGVQHRAEAGSRYAGNQISLWVLRHPQEARERLQLLCANDHRRKHSRLVDEGIEPTQVRRAVAEQENAYIAERVEAARLAYEQEREAKAQAAVDRMAKEVAAHIPARQWHEMQGHVVVNRPSNGYWECNTCKRAKDYQRRHPEPNNSTQVTRK